MNNQNNNYNFQSQVVDKTPVLDLSLESHNQYVERSGIITLSPISPNQHRNETLVFGGFKGFGYWDLGKTEKMWFGIVIGVNPDGTRKYKKISLLDGRMLYLNNPEDALEWHILRHHYSIKGSPNQTGKPRWKVLDERAESKKQLSKSKAFVDVYQFITAMSDSRVKSFGRIFGLDPMNNPADVIKGQLLEKAMEAPGLFEPYMKDSERTNIREAFHRAVSTSVIKVSFDRGYMFNDTIPLGINEEMAIGNLMANKDLFIQIDLISRSKDNSLSKEEREYKIPAGVITTEFPLKNEEPEQVLDVISPPAISNTDF
jgi:hypothetical protein